MTWWWRRREKAAAGARVLRPRPPDTLTDARRLLDQGDLPGALRVLRDAGPTPPAEAHHMRALALAKWKRFREARVSYAEAEAGGLRSARLLIDAAWCDHLVGNHEGALRRLGDAERAEPANAEIPFARGVALMSLARFEDAITCLARVAELDPGYPDCWLNLAVCQHANAHREAAERAAEQALEASPKDVRAWALLGEILAVRGRESESFAALRRAMDLQAESGVDDGALRPWVSSLWHFGRVDEVIDVCARNLGANPDPAIHALYALALLTRGHNRRGWQQYEYRWLGNDLAPHRAYMEQPPWVGQPLQGKTILLRAEQGFGDAIQFARYAVPLKRMGATVVLSVFEGLLPIAKAFVGPDRVVAKGEHFGAFDFHVPLMSLPRLLGQDLGERVPVPYVQADPQKREAWRARLERGDERIVGLVWAGNAKHVHDARRSLPVSEMARLCDAEGCRFISLQKDLRPGDLDSLGAAGGPENLGPELADFADTAALIAELDLVICVDTAVAHLAGALGKEVWVLLPKFGDFRWGEAGSRTAWYPTMRLFRQGEMGNWADVVSRVRDCVQQWVTSPVPVAPPADLGDAVPAALVEVPPIAEVADTRYGVVQYLPGEDNVARSIEALGEHMQAHVELLARFLAQDAHVLEVGAGVGLHTLALARAVGTRGHLMVTEQDLRLKKLLQHNLAANELSNVVSIPRGRLADGSDGRGERGELVYTVDDLCLDRLDVLKVADPGATAILRGARDTLYARRPVVFAITAHEDIEALTNTLWDAGYRCWRMDLPLYRADNYYRVSEPPNLGDAPLAVLAIPEERPVNIDLAGCLELARSTTLSDA